MQSPGCSYYIGLMARLKAAGIDVAMLDDGRIHKVGSQKL